MKPLSGYIYLVLAISTGIAANSFAKISDGFSKLTPTILSIIFMCITMYGLAKAMSMIPVGFTYATNSGITVVAILVFGMIKYNQIPNVYGLIGVVMVNYLGRIN